MGDVRQKAERSNEREGADVRLRKGLVQAKRGGKKGAPFRDHIIDQDNSVRRRKSRGLPESSESQGFVVLAYCRTFRVEGSC